MGRIRIAFAQSFVATVAFILCNAGYAAAEGPALGSPSSQRDQARSPRSADPFDPRRKPVMKSATRLGRLPASTREPALAELPLGPFIDDVLARNPSVQAMLGAWRAAAERFPQVVSLEDPMFGFMVGPQSWGSRDVDDAYMVEARQKVPWPGKRQLRGQEASAQASAASLDVNDTRLQIIETAKLAYFDYYLARRQLEFVRTNRQLLGQSRDVARTKYEAGQVTQQDVLQAEVELADLDRQQIELERIDRVAAARINVLLLRHPTAPLLPPPAKLPGPLELPPSDVLHQVAVQRRPDVAAIGARIRADEAAIALAYREFYPDVELVGRYDAFWQPREQDLRPQVGMNLNVPLYRERRKAAVRETTFRVSQRRAELQQRMLDIQFGVQSAYEQVQESRRTVSLYGGRIVPAAEQNIIAASSNYDVGNTNFLNLIQAQRQLIDIRVRQQQATAEYHRRLAQLERVIGGPIPLVREPEVVPTPSPR